MDTDNSDIIDEFQERLNEKYRREFYKMMWPFPWAEREMMRTKSGMDYAKFLKMHKVGSVPMGKN